MSGRNYAIAHRAHEISKGLDIPYGAAWRVATCVMKASFHDEEAAASAAEQWKDRCPQHPYQCDICGRWHLSKKDERRRDSQDGRD